MTAPLDAIVIGPLNIDLVVVGDAPRDIDALQHWMALSDVTLNVAGSGGYPAQVLQKLGMQTGILSIIADDALGKVIREELAGMGIDVSGVQIAPDELSSIAIYMLLFGSKKRPLTGRPVKHQPWPAPLSPDDKQFLASARLIHMAGYLHYPSMWNEDIPDLFREARRRGQMTSLDPQFPLYPIEGRWLVGIERLLPHVDVLLVDEDEARGITGLDDLEAAGSLLRGTGPRTVVIKRGAAGAMIFDQARRFDQPADRVAQEKIADTIGAGDAFDGGFLAALLDGCDVAEAARIAGTVAALSLRGHGASSALTVNDTIKQLKSRIFPG